MKYKKMRVIVSYVIICGLMFTNSAVLNSTFVEAKSKNTVKLNKKKVKIKVGKKGKLVLKNATKKRIKWTTSKKTVAMVDGKGIVTGIKKGKAKITAKYNGKKYSCKVIVKKAKVNTLSSNDETSNTGNDSYESDNFDTGYSKTGNSDASDTKVVETEETESIGNNADSNNTDSTGSTVNAGDKDIDDNTGIDNSETIETYPGDGGTSYSSEVTSNAKILVDYVEDNGGSIYNEEYTHGGNTVSTTIEYDSASNRLIFTALHSGNGSRIWFFYDVKSGKAVSNKIYFEGNSDIGAFNAIATYEISSYADYADLTFDVEGIGNNSDYDMFCSSYVGLATRAWLSQIKKSVDLTPAEIGYLSY